MKTIRLPAYDCPWCDAHFDAVWAPSDSEPPKSGDLSICMYCKGVARFNDEMKLEKPDDEKVQQALHLLILFTDEGDGKVH